MHFTRFLPFVLVFTAAVAAPASEQEARAVLDRFAAAGKAKDVDAVARLLADDCVLVLTEPAAGPSGTRFFSKGSYLKLLRARYSETGASESTRIIRSASASADGDIFVATEVEEKTPVGKRTELIRSREYIVLRARDHDTMKIRFVVAELVSYVADTNEQPPTK